jgi:methenyltetrahydromethanopterin cyclohydrolase
MTIRLKLSSLKRAKVVDSKILAVLIMVVPTAVLIGALYFSGKIVDQVTYNCNLLMGGWHPDVPAKVIEECRKKRIEK